MILADSKIKEYQKKGIIHIENFNEGQLNPNSYNLRLMNKLLVYDEVVLDMKRENKTREITIPEEGLVLEPGRLYIGSTVEYTETHAPLLAKVDGRSSIGRLGIFVHYTAGFIDTGFCGNITLEIGCTQPVRIYPNIEICQIEYELVEGEVEKPYCGKYQGQTLPTASRMNIDLNKDYYANAMNIVDEIKEGIIINKLKDMEVVDKSNHYDEFLIDGIKPEYKIDVSMKGLSAIKSSNYSRAVPTCGKIDPNFIKQQIRFPLKSNQKVNKTHEITIESIMAYKLYFKNLVISELRDIIEQTLKDKSGNKEALINERSLYILSEYIGKKYKEIHDSIRFKDNLYVEIIFIINFYVEIDKILSELKSISKRYVYFKNTLASKLFDGDFHIKIITETLNNIIERKSEK